MTWTAAIMPDDALPPDSLVGRMLNPLTDETGSGDVILDAQPEPLPLWRVMDRARFVAALEDDDDGSLCAAEIEALRDVMLPEEPEPYITAWPDPACFKRYSGWEERQRLRALLTQQARIARGE